MRYVFLILAFVLSFTAEHSYAESAICHNDQQLQNLWETRYKSLVTENQRTNLAGSDLHHFAQILCYLDTAGIPGFDFYGYFKQLKFSYVFVNDETSSAMARTSLDGTNIEILPKNFFYKAERRGYDFKRMTVLVHEARHLELSLHGKPNQHVLCNHGQFRGQRACDQEFNNNWTDASPYSYEIMTFRKLYDNSSSEYDKKELAEWIVYDLDNSFNYVSPENFMVYTEGLGPYLKDKRLAYRNP